MTKNEVCERMVLFALIPAVMFSSAARAAEVRLVCDLDYVGAGNPRQTLDLFLPVSPAAQALPLVVYVHGGAWMNGDKQDVLWWLLPLVKEGKFAAATINYRLTDEAIWPAQIHDCKAAVRWLRAHAAEYGYNPDRIAVWGASAGGHLVAMLGTTQGVEDMEGELGDYDDVSSAVTCVVDVFGPGDLLTMNDHPGSMDHNAPDSPESRLLGGPILENPEKAKQASPQTWVSKDDAPFLLLHGNQDDIVPYQQSVEFEKALEKAGVPVVFITVDGGGHGRGFGPDVRTSIQTFLAHHLLGAEETVEDGTIKADE